MDLKGNEHTVVFNTESAWHFLTNKVYRDYVSDCHNIAIDGVGLKFALKLRGCRVERFHGPDLCQSLINNSGVSGDNILLVGGHQSNYTLVERKIADGFFPLPFIKGANDYQSLGDDLKRFTASFSGRKVLLISLGLPKQEIFCLWLLKTLRSDSSIDCDEIIIIPVGAALDFLSGHKKRGGILWQQFGLEWLPSAFQGAENVSTNIKVTYCDAPVIN